MLTPRTIRLTGLGASVLLALAGGLGGATPHGDVAATPARIAHGPHGTVILIAWLAGTLVQGAVWWAARDRIPSVRWAAVTAGWWLVPFLVVPPMGSRDVYSYACQGQLFVHGLSPYANGVSALPCSWIDAVSPIWRDVPAPYGPLFVFVAAAAVLLGTSLIGVIALLRLVAVAGVVVTGLCLPVLARRCGVPPERAVWVALAGPLVGAHLIAGPHNDALMIALTVAGLAMLTARPDRRGALLGAGLLLGCAVAVKVTAIVVVPFALLLALRRPGGRAATVRRAGAVLGAATAAMIALTAVSGLGVGWLAGVRHTQDLIQFTSPPTAVGMTLTYAGRLVRPGFDAVPAARLLGLVVLAALLVRLWWQCAVPAGDPVPAALRGAALAFAATVALAPSFHPWYALAPLALLAATTSRTDLAMAVTVAASLLVLPDGSGLARYAKFPGAPLVTLVVLLLLVRRPPARTAAVRSRPLSRATVRGRS